MNTRGSFETSAILGIALAATLAYGALLGTGIVREQLRIETLVAEAHAIQDAVEIEHLIRSNPKFDRWLPPVEISRVTEGVFVCL